MDVDDQNNRASTSGASTRVTRQSPRTAPPRPAAARPRNVAKGGSGPASRTNRAPATATGAPAAATAPATAAATAATATAAAPTAAESASRPAAVGVAGPSTSRQAPARPAAGRQPGGKSPRPSRPSHDPSGLASLSTTALVSSLAVPATAQRVPRHPRPKKNKSEHVPKSLRMCSSSMKRKLQPKRVILLRI